MTDTAAGLHRHGWRDTGRMEKTCGGCSTIAFRVKQPDGRWQMAWRPALAEQVRRQLENAGIDKDDPGLQRVRAWNERLGGDSVVGHRLAREQLPRRRKHVVSQVHDDQLG